MKKIFRNIALFAATAMAAVGCAPDQGEIIDTIELNRALTPLEFKASVIATKGTDVEFSWEVMDGVEKYELQLFAAAEDAEGNTIAPDYDNVEPIATNIVLPEEVPFVVKNLTVDSDFYARVRSHKTNLEPSKWAALEEDFSTFAVRSSLNPKVTERGVDYIVVSWDAAEDKGDLTTLRVAPVRDGEEVVIELTSADKSACTKRVEGLTACTDYRFELVFGKSGSRGITTGWTRPSDSGFNTVDTVEAIVNALTGTIGDVKLLVEYNDGVPYDLPPFEDIKCNLYLVGKGTGDGKKPIINNLDIRPKVAIEKIHIQDLALDGVNTAGFVIDNKGAKITELAIINCEITGYTKGVLYGSGGAGSGCDDIRIEGCYIHDLNNELAANGNAIGGGDLLDFRNGEYKNFNIVNNTWSYCGRSFLRIDIATESIVVANNTFNAVGIAANTNGIFYVTKVAPQAFTSSKNVFLNMNSDIEAVVAKVGLGKNGSGGFAPKFENCYFFNVASTYFNGSKYTAWGAETTFGEADALADGGKSLTEDPCVNSAGAKLYLNTTSDIATKKIGDPRWWNAQQPVIVRATELTLVTEPYIWDFTTKSKFDTETLEKATIIDNVRIYGTAEVPAEVVMGEGVKFSKGAMVNAEGEPEYSAVGVLTEGYGAIVVTAKGESGIETMQVLAGGDRYTILADGEPHKVVLGDLAGENNIYVLASSAVTLTKVEWTKDITPDQTVFPLAKPAINLSANSLDEGTAEAVTVSWDAVENADRYVLTGLGQTLTFYSTDALSLTVPAEQVAVMPVGEYEITLTAYPVETSTKYSVSETATATFKIKKVVAGDVEVTWSWNFSEILVNSNGTLTPADGTYILKNDGTTEAATNDNLPETLYLVAASGKTVGAKKYANTADGVDYYGISYGGGAAYSYFVVEHPGTLKITATQGKSVAEGSNSQLAVYKNEPKQNQIGENMVLVGYDTAVAKNNAQTYTFEVTDITEPTKIIIYKPTGSTSPVIYNIEYTYVQKAAAQDYVMTLSANGNALSSNITGLPSSYTEAETTWTATDDSGSDTITFVGNVYHSAAKGVMWYFNKGKTEIHIAAEGFGKIKKITLTLESARKPEFLICKTSDGTRVNATEVAGTNASPITFDFEAAGVSTDGFRIDYDKSLGSDIKAQTVVIEYSK